MWKINEHRGNFFLCVSKYMTKFDEIWNIALVPLDNAFLFLGPILS